VAVSQSAEWWWQVMAVGEWGVLGLQVHNAWGWVD
jgi:hypothetical protein